MYAKTPQITNATAERNTTHTVRQLSGEGASACLLKNKVICCDIERGETPTVVRAGLIAPEDAARVWGLALSAMTCRCH